MPNVEMTRHLYRFFPQLEKRKISVAAGSIAEVLDAIDEIAPGFSDYIRDEQGALRRHVNVCINNDIIVDKKNLSDHASDKDTVFIFQSLTGG